MNSTTFYIYRDINDGRLTYTTVLSPNTVNLKLADIVKGNLDKLTRRMNVMRNEKADKFMVDA